MSAPLALSHSASSSGSNDDSQLRPASGYTNPGALALNASRQPSSVNPTQVIMSVQLNVNDNQNLTANIQISSDNVTWDTIASMQHYFDVRGLLGVTGDSDIRMPTTFEIPAGWYYRVTQSGSGTVSINQIRERAI